MSFSWGGLASGLAKAYVKQTPIGQAYDAASSAYGKYKSDKAANEQKAAATKQYNASMDNFKGVQSQEFGSQGDDDLGFNPDADVTQPPRDIMELQTPTASTINIDGAKTATPTPSTDSLTAPIKKAILAQVQPINIAANTAPQGEFFGDKNIGAMGDNSPMAPGQEDLRIVNGMPAKGRIGGIRGLAKMAAA